MFCCQVDVEKPEDVRLIDLDETHSGEHTVFIMPPEEPQEPDGSECPALYRYRFWSHSSSAFSSTPTGDDSTVCGRSRRTDTGGGSKV